MGEVRSSNKDSSTENTERHAAFETIGILSMGEMGAAIAALLTSNNYKVVTYTGDRSKATQDRALEAKAIPLDSVNAVVEKSDCILSIVPPRNAIATAERVRNALESVRGTSIRKLLYYADFNAISPNRAVDIEKLFDPAEVKYMDGGIIGGPPKLQPDGTLKKPSLVMSGHTRIKEVIKEGAQFEELLNIKWVSDVVGGASGLKMCFASLTKGLTALAIQSFTTADALGVLPQLQSLHQVHSPKIGELSTQGLLGMQKKAYRWVDEMSEIANTFDQAGGFQGSSEHRIFQGISDVYKFVDEKTELGTKPASDVDGVAAQVQHGLRNK